MGVKRNLPLASYYIVEMVWMGVKLARAPPTLVFRGPSLAVRYKTPTQPLETQNPIWYYDTCLYGRNGRKIYDYLY